MSRKTSLRKILQTFFLLSWLSSHSTLLGQEQSPFPVIPEWALTVGTAVYTPDNLWNVIDGAADAYLLYGFTDLHIGEYLSPDSTDVRAELYKHSSTANAFGIYSQERKPEYDYVNIGTEGYAEEGVLNFLDGIYYVKLTSHTMGNRGLAALRTVAESLSSYLHQKKALPPQLTLLPPEEKIQKSESYIADSFLGYSFFRSAYVAQYDSGGKTQLFVMEFESPAAARTVLSRYMETLKISGSQTKDGRYTLADPNNGTIGMLLEGKYLCGVVNCENEKKREGHLGRLEKTIAGNAEAGK